MRQVVVIGVVWSGKAVAWEMLPCCLAAWGRSWREKNTGGEMEDSTTRTATRQRAIRDVVSRLALECRPCAELCVKAFDVIQILKTPLYGRKHQG